MFLLPGRQFLVLVPAVVRDGQPGAPATAVGDHRGGGADGGLRAGVLSGQAVIVVAGQRLADGYHEAGVVVDDDLAVGGVAVVLAGGGHGPVAGGDQRAVPDEHGLLTAPPPGLEGESRPEVGDDPVSRRLRDAEQQG